MSPVGLGHRPLVLKFLQRNFARMEDRFTQYKRWTWKLTKGYWCWRRTKRKIFCWTACLSALPQELDESLFHNASVYIHWLKRSRKPTSGFYPPGQEVFGPCVQEIRLRGGDRLVNRILMNFLDLIMIPGIWHEERWNVQILNKTGAVDKEIERDMTSEKKQIFVRINSILGLANRASRDQALSALVSTGSTLAIDLQYDIPDWSRV
jgi:hypothetical protein